MTSLSWKLLFSLDIITFISSRTIFSKKYILLFRILNCKKIDSPSNIMH